MADNYLQFSEVVANLTEPEEAWLKEQLQPIRVFADKEYPEDAVPAELANTEPDWTGVRFLRDKTDHDPDWDALGFEYNFHDDHDTEGGAATCGSTPKNLGKCQTMSLGWSRSSSRSSGRTSAGR